jgi:hypothetical protein
MVNFSSGDSGERDVAEPVSLNAGVRGTKSAGAATRGGKGLNRQRR